MKIFLTFFTPVEKVIMSKLTVALILLLSFTDCLGTKGIHFGYTNFPNDFPTINQENENPDVPDIEPEKDVTLPEKYPYLAKIFLNSKYVCSGSLITENYIITSGHCGIPPQLSGSLDSKVARFIEVEITGIPDNISAINVVMDLNRGITLIKLETSISPNLVKPILLPIKDIEVAENATFVAWILDPNDGFYISETSSIVISNELCPSNTTLNHICIGYNKNCQEDSKGGALIEDYEDVNYIVGIPVAAIRCAKSIEVMKFVRIYPHKSWIESIIYYE